MKLLLLAACVLLPRLAAQAVLTRDSGRPGPRLLVVGGIHGDEPSGALAAKALAKGLVPKRGTLLLLPEANPEALAAGVRSQGSPAVDLNRTFPGTDTSRPATIFALARSADLVLDLHEEGRAWTEADLPTLVLSPAASTFAMALLETLEARGIRFAFTGGAPAGSLVGELGNLGRMAMVVEVPARWSLQRRIRTHRLVVEAACAQLGMR